MSKKIFFEVKKTKIKKFSKIEVTRLKFTRTPLNYIYIHIDKCFLFFLQNFINFNKYDLTQNISPPHPGSVIRVFSEVIISDNIQVFFTCFFW